MSKKKRPAELRPDPMPKTAPAFSTRRRDLWLGALLIVVTLIAYSPAIKGGVLWDDDYHITKPELQSFHGLARIWFEVGATLQYYPLLHSAFWVEHKIWGDATPGYHLLNILLHALAAMLVVVILRRLAIPGAYLAGAVFALHPVQVESVAWISEQKNLLSAVFYLCAMLVYLRFDRTRRVGFYLGALGLFVLALLSKTVTATLPGALLVIFWWQRGRLSWRRDVAPVVPMFLLGAGAGLVTSWWELKINQCSGPDFQFTGIQRILIAGRTLWFLLGKLCWPVHLAFSYPRWPISPVAAWTVLFPLGALAVLAALWAVSHRTRAPLAAALFFGGTLFPVLGFFNLYTFRYSFVADHYVYLAGLGIITLVAGGVTALPALARSEGRTIGRVLGLVLLVMLAGLTWRQCRMYKSAETLYRETLVYSPDCWMAHNNLGVLLAKDPGRLAEGIGHFEAAVRLKPDYSEAQANLGNALARIPGRMPEAIAHLETALRIRPDFPAVLIYLGGILAEVPGRASEAVAYLDRALRIEPASSEAHFNMGLALLAVPGRSGDAIAEFEAALKFRPDYAEAHYNLGIALAGAQRLAEAKEHFEQALRFNPDLADAHINLGVVLDRENRTSEAIGHFQEALRINPDSAQALDDLGLAFGRVNRLSEAIRQFQQAVRMDPGFAEAHYHLGIALIRDHRLAEAQEQFQQALRLNPALDQARAALQHIQKDPQPGR